MPCRRRVLHSFTAAQISWQGLESCVLHAASAWQTQKLHAAFQLLASPCSGYLAG